MGNDSGPVFAAIHLTVLEDNNLIKDEYITRNMTIIHVNFLTSIKEPNHVF